MHVYIKCVCVSIYIHSSLHFHTRWGRRWAAEGEREGRGESAAGARPGTTQGKLNRQTTRLKWVPWHNHESRQSTTQGRNGQEGHATERFLKRDHAPLP